MRTFPIDVIRRAPKVLLHDHLDGGLRPSTMVDLAREQGYTKLPTHDPDELGRWFFSGADRKDLTLYLQGFDHVVAVMQDRDSLMRIAAECAEDLAADGVVYAEVRFAPEQHQEGGLTLDEIVNAVQEGFAIGIRAAAAAGRPIVIGTLLSAMRQAARSSDIAELAIRHRDDKVVGFDIAGAETGWPPSLHAEAFAHARASHLNITVHASEPPDLELISDALAQGAHRIGHGVRLRADVEIGPDGTVVAMGRLARHVLDRGIHLEMAPTCNVQIGAVPSVADHPIGPFLRAGFRVNVNTDNRLMSHVSVGSEVRAVTEAFSLSRQEVGRLAEHGLDAAFAPLEVRQRILREIVRPAYAA